MKTNVRNLNCSFQRCRPEVGSEPEPASGVSTVLIPFNLPEHCDILNFTAFTLPYRLTR
ncbi:hypothetical protein KCP78_16800 [Salmonella enterica subsp. enterica]|nr:hypothetical protein KCP78_16800 [Salmonella enterica subsp. enterica]